MRAEKLELIEKQKGLDYIADRIYILESSGGKNDGCTRDGLGYNGFGYAMPSTKLVCFDSHDRVRGYVKEWFDKRLSTGMTLNQALCGYNQGFAKQLKDCDYARKYKSL